MQRRHGTILCASRPRSKIALMLTPNQPLSLYHKSKTLLWDPCDLDFTQDATDWRERMSPRERELILTLATLFLGGEQAVTHDLAPMLTGVRRLGGRMEEEMFLTAQLFEESKHVEFFERWFDQVTGPVTLPAPGDAYRTLFEQRLPQALDRLCGDAPPEAHVVALCTYHMTIEGVLAETGYRGYVRALKQNGLMPATVAGVELVQRDEARHIAYGLYALNNWFVADPSLRTLAQTTLDDLLGVVFEVVSETFAPFGDDIPFGLDPSEFIAYAGEQFDARMRVLER
jgi:ribonucleoside-diphosphate reductase beta chain